MEEVGKIIILSAPSGTGKSTIIKRIIDDEALNLGFSVSCTSRQPRQGEVHGREYYFITDEEFMRRIEAGDFVEWEQVYAGTHYGTLAEEVERVTGSGRNLIMDIDVKGGINVKSRYGGRALAIFVMPPDIEVLGKRLHARGTDSEQTIAQRLAKAGYEMTFAPQYDMTVINDDLDSAVAQVREAIKKFVGR